MNNSHLINLSSALFIIHSNREHIKRTQWWCKASLVLIPRTIKGELTSRHNKICLISSPIRNPKIHHFSWLTTAVFQDLTSLWTLITLILKTSSSFLISILRSRQEILWVQRSLAYSGGKIQIILYSLWTT
jgi:hypothetical protein